MYWMPFGSHHSQSAKRNAMLIITAKVLISLVCTLALAGLLRYQTAVCEWLGSKSLRLALAVGWLLLRLCPFLLVFVILDFTPSSDLDGFFGQASQAAAGKWVYRDFSCMYSPLFPYLNALALKFWFDRKAIVLLMIFMEALALYSTIYFYKTSFSKAELLFRALVYLLLPGTLVLCVLGGQEDVWMWLIAVLAYLAWQRTGRVAWFGVVLALGFLLTKAVFILFCPVLFFLVPQPQKWLLSLAGIGLVALLIVYHYTGLAFLNQPLNEANTLRAPNWASVLNPWVFDKIGVGTKFWNWLGLLVTAGSGVFVAYRVRAMPFERAFSAVWVVVYGTMMVAQQSAYSNYIFIFLLPLTFIWIDFKSPKEVAIFLLFNAFCVVQPSLWWRLRSPIYRNPAAIFTDFAHTADYLLQVGIVAGTIYFVALVYKKATA